MRCSRKLDALLFGLVLLLFIGTTQAADIVAERARLIAGDEGYSLNADYKVSLNPRLEEAVNKGIALFFTAEIAFFALRPFAKFSTLFRLSLLETCPPIALIL